ncbi:MAG: hypothetical protein JNL30_05745 [Rubrivivax sp.]|nr:hypothetical protein [Rubrivivax sp.]
MAKLFALPFDVPAAWPGVVGLEARIVTSAAETAKLRFELEVRRAGGEVHTVGREVVLKAPHGLSHAGFSYESLTETLTLEVDLAQPQPVPFGDEGLVGLALRSQAQLSAVRLVLRPRPGGSDWGRASPCFELTLCWAIDAAAAAGAVFPVSFPGGRNDIAAAASAQVELCATLAGTVPQLPAAALPALQWKLEWPSFGLGTGWSSWSLFEGGDGSLFSLDWLLRWFGNLVDAWPTLNLPSLPRLPDWSLPDLPRLELKVPFGIGARDVGARIERAEAGGYAVQAWAKDFHLRWGETDLDLPGRLELLYDTASRRYTFVAALLEKSYPTVSAEPKPWRFALPLDLLWVEADCWYFRFGLFSTGSPSALGRLCLEVLLEVGGLELRSRFGDADDEDGLYRTDLRLLVRDWQVLSNQMPSLVDPNPPAPPPLFADVGFLNEPFRRYGNTPIPALSFAKDLLEEKKPNEPANDYGVRFLDGDFRLDERVFVLWRQYGLRFLRALGHTLLGREAAGEVAEDEGSTLFGLEIARFDGGAVTQVRLDWRPEDAGAPPAHAGTRAPAPFTGECIEFTGDPLPKPEFNLPLAAPGVFLDVAPARARELNFAAISLQLARSDEQTIVVRREADGATSLAHLLLFAAPAAAPAPAAAVAPIARARIGFSVKSDQGQGGRRDVAETNQPGSFLTAAVGYGGAGAAAVRTVAWRKGANGHSLRFMQTLAGDAPPLNTLLPPGKPLPASGDPGCPPPKPLVAPVPVAFDAFETPAFDAQGWRLSVEIAALQSLFRAFTGPANPAGQSVGFRILEICGADGSGAAPGARALSAGATRAVVIRTELMFALGQGEERFEAKGRVAFRFDLGDLSLGIEGGAQLDFALASLPATPGWAAEVPLPEDADRYWYSQPKKLLGLEMTALVPNGGVAQAPEQLGVLVLSLRDGLFTLGLPAGRSLLLRYTKLGRDSLNFWVSTFVLGPGGLDLEAALLASTVRVRGLARPFALERAALRIRASRLEYLAIDASGKLPELLNEAPVKLSIAFAQPSAGGAIDLDQMHCELGDKDAPIFSRGTRFKFEITQLGIEYLRDAPAGERHFFFELTGSAQFSPDTGEFSGGLLEDLESARIEFVRAPLTDEFHQHLKLVVELKKPVTFEVYKLFRMEIRSIGFEPRFDGFAEPGAAIVIGGQCQFAQRGDIISADIQFHALRLGFPRRGSSVPQWHFEDLRVEIATEACTIAGRVATYDTDTRKGFAGEGSVEIKGLPRLAAAFAFIRLRETAEEPWQHAWFIAIEASRMSFQVASLPIYLRQVGLGFGFRYTLPLIARFDEPQASIAELLRVLLDAVDRQQSLATLESWEARPGPVRWTIALESVFTLGTTHAGFKGYKSEREKKLMTLVAQVFAAFRSDFTVAAGAKVWYPVSLDDFYADTEGMRARPLASGFMIYSVPQSRFLAHAAKGRNPYLGPKDKPMPEVLKDVLRLSHFEATLLIEPGLLHAELGWPDRLMFSWKVGSLQLECRGGLLLRLERDLLVQGLFFSARGGLKLAGGFDGGFIGLRAEAQINVYFAARLLAGIQVTRPLDSNVYAAIGLDVGVRFSVSAWLRIKIGFVKIRISISFSFSLQIVVALELGWAGQGDLGFKARAQLRIGIFGRTLGVAVAVGLNEGGVDRARAALAPYMGSLLEPGQVPALPGVPNSARAALAAPGVGPAAAAAATARPAAQSARTARAAKSASTARAAESASTARAAVGAPAAAAAAARDHFVSAYVQGAQGDESLWFLWVMPGPNGLEFYPAPRVTAAAPKQPLDYATLDFTGVPLAGITLYTWRDGQWVAVPGTEALLQLNPHAAAALTTEAGAEVKDGLTLQTLLAGSWLPDDPKQFDLPPAAGGEKLPFPQYWPPADSVPVALVTPDGHASEATPLEDTRVRDARHPDRAPNRRLDRNHPYDRALIDAMARAVDPTSRVRPPADAGRAAELQEQARGNQSFLIQAFHDDLVTIARSTTLTGGRPVTTGLAGGAAALGRPTLLDLGMVVCVRARARPAWLHQRADAAGYPRLRFKAASHAQREFPLQPVVDFEKVDFEKNPPVFAAAPPYFDDEVIGLAWQLQWAGLPPSFADGARRDVEAYLRAYEIVFFDVESGRVLRTVTTTPSELEVPAAAGGTAQRLRLRYQFTIARAELLGGQAGASDQRLTTLGATITPISQTGRRGAPFTATLQFEPRLAPLPADDARLVLGRPARGQAWSARLAWRELALPATGGVAVTDGWHLVLRPLAAVPLGAYPDDTVDVADRGLMSATGQALIEGDIVVKLPRIDSAAARAIGLARRKPERPQVGEADPDAEFDRAPALWLYELPLEAGRDYSALLAALYDHRGQPVSAGSPLGMAAAAFLARESAAAAGGRAWRLFLRATTDLEDDTRLQSGRGLSGLAQLRLWLAAPQAGQASVERPLPHFEWPVWHELADPGQVPEGGATAQLQDVAAFVGPLQVPVPVLETGGEVSQLRYIARPGRTRAVQVVWNAGVPLHAQAAYDLFELPLEDLVNADLAPDSGFTPAWRWIKRVQPTDAALAAQTPATMADVQNWEAQPPAFVRTAGWLDRHGVPAAEMSERWPGWWSWRESELHWPTASFEGRPDPRFGLDGKGTFDARLALWRQRGREVTKLRLHDYLAMLVGQLAEQAGSGAEAAFEVQVIAGPGTSLKTPQAWLQANTEALDPYGWAALHVLGLALTLALRDPVSGLLLPQGELHGRVLAAVKALHEQGQATGSPVVEAAMSGAARHFALDLPVQHLRAYRSGQARSRRDDAALSMLQLSLRPLPSPVLRYAVAQLRVDSDGPTEAPFSVAQRADIRFAVNNPVRPSVHRPPVLVGPASGAGAVPPVSLARTFFDGDLILLRAEDPAALLRALANDATGLKADPELVKGLQAFAQQPLGLVDAKTTVPQGLDVDALALTPFERFDVDFAFWAARLKPPAGDSSYRRFLDDLVELFAPRDADDKATAALKAALAEADRAEEGHPLLALYLAWSARFFRTAPLAVDDRFENVTVTQPKTVEPLRFTVDGQGRMAYTQPVEEEWAGERAYAVVPVGRYQRLLAAPAEVPPVLPQLAGGRADVELPRVRRLEAPKLLSVRVIADAAGRWFHELVVAHPERSLAQSNIAVRRKLAFGEIQRAYRRRFLHSAWLDLLEAAGVVGQPAAGLPRPPDRAGPAGSAGPAAGEPLRAGDDTLLAAAPQARWDATRYLDAAEPHYYEQVVRYRASAAEAVFSEEKQVVLAAPPAWPVGPLAAAPVVLGTVSWRGPKAVQHDEWAAQLAGSPALPHLARSGHLLDIRWPRLIESLDPASLAGPAAHFAAEVARYTLDGTPFAPVGCLPDPEVRLAIVSEATTGSATIATIETVLDADPDAPPAARLFTLRPQAADFELGELTIAVAAVAAEPAGPDAAPADWADGVHVRVAVSPALVAIVQRPPGPSRPFGVPTLLAAVNPAPSADPAAGSPLDQLLDARALPARGPLQQLAPLALRLQEEGNRVRMLDPLPARPWLCRPHVQPPATAAPTAGAPATQRDLALGLRLVVDLERRRAAALLAWDAEAAAGEQPPNEALADGATGLLHRLEESDIALLLGHRDLLPLEPQFLPEWERLGLTLWRREADAPTAPGGQPAAGRWRQVTDGQGLVEVGWSLLLYQGPPPGTQGPVFEALTWLDSTFVDAERGFRPARTFEFNARMDELAGLAYRSAPMRPPAVYVQRGNAPRLPWPRAQ